MRILGADDFKDKDSAIAKIPINYLNQGDMCFVQISDADVDSDYENAVYFYKYSEDDSNDENIPFIIIPSDNLGSSGRWVLDNIYTDQLFVDETITNTISSTNSSIDVGDTLTIDASGIDVVGQMDISSNVLTSPMTVNSNVIVYNMNVEYLGGHNSDYYLKNNSGREGISNGVSEIIVTLNNEISGTLNYSVFIDISNLVDTDPTIYSYTITDKQYTTFTVKLSGVTDSENYVLNWFIVGEDSSESV